MPGPDATPALQLALRQRILVLDGAMGTVLQRQGLREADYRGARFAHAAAPDLRGNHDLLNLTCPERIQAVHEAYLAAGADIIETNSFNANRVAQAEYGLADAVGELNHAAATLARRAAARFATAAHPRWVAGCLGPTGKTLSLSPDVQNPGFRAISFDELADAYAEQVAALLAGGVDLLLIETVFDTLNAKAALLAAERAMAQAGRRVPLLVSGTITDAGGRTLAGQTVEAFLISLEHAGLLSIGLNCALGAQQLRPFLESLAAAAPMAVSAHPNAGLPNALGEYEQTPAAMAATLAEFAQAGLLNIVGGCCGTTPEHIRAIAAAVAGVPPRRPPEREKTLRLSGLEPFTLTPESNFINIGERTNVAGSRHFARLIQERQYEAALAIARQQVENGAQILDINMDDAMLDAPASMTAFLRHLATEPDLARVPLMLDSANWEALVAGLKCVQGKAIVNSLSLKEGEARFLERARTVRQFGAALVVMAFDEQGQADSLARKTAICARAYRLLTEQAAFPPEDLIFDANVLAIATGLAEHRPYAVAFIDAVRWIKQNLPHARTSGGISNLSFAFRGHERIRGAMHAVFLYHAVRAGLDLGIVNAGNLVAYEEIPPALRGVVEDVVLNRHQPAAEEKLIEWAQEPAGAPPVAAAAAVQAWRQAPPRDRLRHAVVKGIGDFLAADLAAARPLAASSLELIEGPLMDGLNQVGELFGAGKMFLPQVVKSARVMKQAVALLQPHLEQEKAAAAPGAAHRRSPKVLLATVKGDVHDIGKNIVSVVLACNQCEIRDLGVMVPSEQIVATARSWGADLVGLSGLITPSLEEMTHVAREMARQGLAMPLLIGGATTSKLHTAVKIEPAYGHGVIHVRDASRAAGIVARLMDPDSRPGFLAQTRAEYAELRAAHARATAATRHVPLAQARANRWRTAWDRAELPRPRQPGRHRLADLPIAPLRPLINWMFLMHAWDLGGTFPAILDDPAKGETARRLLHDANALLDRWEQDQPLRAAAVFGLWPANSVGDDLELYHDETRATVLTTFHQLRNQEALPPGQPNLCLADFVAPRDSGRRDWLGAFAVTAGLGLEALVAEFTRRHDDYSALLARTLADRLAEAAAEWLHREIRTRHWGYAPTEQLTPDQLFRQQFRGIRPAHGYPACPDHSEKGPLFQLLDAAEIGLTLTEHFMMRPAAAVSGLIFAHPAARYFCVGTLEPDQLRDYAARKQMPVAEVERWLAANRA